MRAGETGREAKATNVSDQVPLTRSTRTMRVSEGTPLAEHTAASRGSADDLGAVLDDTSAHRSSIGCVVPAHNKEDSIAQVLEALLGQTRVPDVIHVVVSNTSDRTVGIASSYAGPHEVATELGEQFTEVFVHDIGRIPGTRAGALNYGYTLVEGHDYLLGVDGDVVADVTAVEHLEAEATSDSRIGGISAISSLGALFSIFLTQALRDVMNDNHRSTPWIDGSEDADTLSRQLESAGYLSRVVTERQALSMLFRLIRRKGGCKV